MKRVVWHILGPTAPLGEADRERTEQLAALVRSFGWSFTTGPERGRLRVVVYGPVLPPSPTDHDRALALMKLVMSFGWEVSQVKQFREGVLWIAGGALALLAGALIRR